MNNSNNEIIPGFEPYRASLMERIIPILDEYMLCKLKIEQLRQRGHSDNDQIVNEIHYNKSRAKRELNRIIRDHPTTS